MPPILCYLLYFLNQSINQSIFYWTRIPEKLGWKFRSRFFRNTQAFNFSHEYLLKKITLVLLCNNRKGRWVAGRGRRALAEGGWARRSAPAAGATAAVPGRRSEPDTADSTACAARPSAGGGLTGGRAAPGDAPPARRRLRTPPDKSDRTRRRAPTPSEAAAPPAPVTPPQGRGPRRSSPGCCWRIGHRRSPSQRCGSANFEDEGRWSIARLFMGHKVLL